MKKANDASTRNPTPQMKFCFLLVLSIIIVRTLTTCS